MIKIFIFLGIAFASYWVIWTIIYIWIMGLNFKYYWQYFWASWWNPGELPGLIWFYSFFLTIIILLLISFSFFLKDLPGGVGGVETRRTL